MNMNQVIQASNPGSSGLPGKRKRGRPRKYPKLNSEGGSRIPKLQRMRWEEKKSSVVGAGTGGPPGFVGPATGPTGEPTESMVGRAVSGVIEAVFDAGYLLNVRVANSDTTLRGVIFRPGKFVPVSNENDVAPNVQMIRRTEIQVPREKKEQHNQPQPQPQQQEQQQVVSKGKQVSLLAPVIPKENLTPVVLEPGKSSLSSNSLPVVNDSNIGAASMLKQQLQNGSVDPLVSDVASAEIENGAKPSNRVVAPFENLVTEVIKRIETPVVEARSVANDETLVVKNGGETNAKNEVGGGGDDHRALNIEPLQAVQIDENANTLGSGPKPMEVDRTSKMSQLLEGTISDSPATNSVAVETGETLSIVSEQGSLGGGTINTEASFF